MFLLLEVSDPDGIDVMRRDGSVAVREVARATRLSCLVADLEGSDAMLAEVTGDIEKFRTGADSYDTDVVPFAGLLHDSGAVDAAMERARLRLLAEPRLYLPPEDEDESDVWTASAAPVSPAVRAWAMAGREDPDPIPVVVVGDDDDVDDPDPTDTWVEG